MFIYAIVEVSSAIMPYLQYNKYVAYQNLTRYFEIHPGQRQACQRKPNSIHFSYYWEFIQTPLFIGVQIRSVFRFVQLCCKFTQVSAFTPWYKRVEAYMGNLIFIHFFLHIYFIRFDPNLGIAPKKILLIRTNIYKVLQFIRLNLPSVNET